MKRTLVGAMIVGVLVFILGSGSLAAGPGTTAAEFLKIGVGARANAMGEAFTAISDDGTALYWNPAGLAQLKEGELSAMYNLWFQEIRQGYLSLAFPLLGGTVGLGANYVDMGSLEGRDEQGNLTGTFRAYDAEASIGYANRVYKGLMFGLTVGALQDAIGEDKEVAYLGNVGCLVRAAEFFSLGAVVQNIGTKLGTDPLPLTLKAGSALRLGLLSIAADVTKAIDVSKPQEGEIYYCAGAEWWIGNILALRAGYKTNQDIGPGITAGAGLKAGKVRVDYAYIPYGDLGDTHRVSLGIGF